MNCNKRFLRKVSKMGMYKSTWYKATYQSEYILEKSTTVIFVDEYPPKTIENGVIVDYALGKTYIRCNKNGEPVYITNPITGARYPDLLSSVSIFCRVNEDETWMKGWSPEERLRFYTHYLKPYNEIEERHLPSSTLFNLPYIVFYLNSEYIYDHVYSDIVLCGQFVKQLKTAKL